MPNKYNPKWLQHIPKMKFQAKNWAEYDAGLLVVEGIRTRYSPNTVP